MTRPPCSRALPGALALLFCGCVDTSAPAFSSVWDPQRPVALPVLLAAQGPADSVVVTWQTSGTIEPLPAQWRLLAGECGASPAALVEVARGDWPADGRGTVDDPGRVLGQCRTWRLQGATADGARLTQPSAEATFTPSACSTGWKPCGGDFCLDLGKDSAHCGDCGVTCAALSGSTCKLGLCVCPAGLDACGGACIDTSADPARCGASCADCAATVGTGATCAAGVCQCPAGQLTCGGGACLDRSADSANCGACGTDCAKLVGTGATCSDGQCGCPGTLHGCGGDCVDTSADASRCGTGCKVCATTVGAGAVCQSGVCQCPSGQLLCGGACVDPASDAANCNGCGKTCAASYASGATCQAAVCKCPAGQQTCGGACVDTRSDASNCGFCGLDCAVNVGTGALCRASACGCPAGQDSCGGACRDTSADAAHCGAACAVCGAGQICQVGSCVSATAWREWPAWPLPFDPPAAYAPGTGAAAGTVMDLRTNLVWQQTDDGVQYDLAGAKAHCASLALGGVGAGGWRLPTAIELLTLVDDTKASPAINTKIFPGTQSGLYWSSTTDGYGRVWYVDFASGSDATLGVGSTFTPFARCVH